MKKLTKTPLPGCKFLFRMVALACVALVTPGDPHMLAQAGQAPAAQENQVQSLEQLESLVAPIALYPDALLAQILAASTYPLQIVEANRWLQANSSLQGDALAQEAAKQDWESSVQALVVFPDVLGRMDQNLKWTTALGNAFLAQEGDVMAAIQSMRQKAHAAGALQSNSQQKVEATSQEGQQVIVIQPANPQVIYVPTYNPVVVYGPPPVYYPYPVMVYPPPPPAGTVIAASMIAFGAGIALGAAFNGCCGYGGWGWGCNWGARSITINTTFVTRYRLTPTPYVRVSGRTVWAHSPNYRGPVPYSSAAVAGRYGAAVGVRTPYGAAGAAVGPRGGVAVGAVGPNGARGAVATPYGTARGVATPYGSAATAKGVNGAAAGVRTPNGAAGAAVGPRGGVAAGAVGPNGARGAVATPYGTAQGVRTANGSAGTVSTKNGTASAVKTPYGSAVKTPNGTYTSPQTANKLPSSTQPRNFGGANNSGSASAFTASGNSKSAQTTSNRGYASLNGAGTRANGAGVKRP